MVSESFSNGSKISMNPFWYVETNVANVAIFDSCPNSDKSVISKVRTNEANLSEQKLKLDIQKTYRKGFRSIKVTSLTCCKKEIGVSATTCITRILV